MKEKTNKLNKQAQKIVSRLLKLQSLGYKRKQTLKVLENLELPLGLHLTITGNWSSLGLV